MNKLFFNLLALLLCGLFLVPTVGVGQLANKHNNYKKLTDVPQRTWDKLATKKFFFGHHSVGSNILQGVEDILKEHPNIKLNIIHARKMGDRIRFPALVHGNVGHNMDPESKIASFKQKIEDGYGLDADIAFFKFCFIDFNPATDIDKLFRKYKDTMDDLIQEYPHVVFAVVTVPLTCYAPGIHGWIKRCKDIIKQVIGKLNIYDHSSANRFNELLLKEYEGKLPVFDLAKFESTRPDGTRIYKMTDGKKNFELFQEYTDDGGHLNALGRKVIGEKFLLFLAEIAENSSSVRTK